MIKQDESGVVSLIIVSILAIVLALIAVGFSKLSDRELRQASERELASQAYYSANAGINDAIAYLKAGGTDLTGCYDWQTTSPGPQYFASSISGTSKYSCVSVTRKSKNLIYSLKAWQTKTIVVTAPNMGTLYLSWEKQGQNNTGTPLGSIGTLPQETDPIFSSATTTGLLRVGLYPTSNNSIDNNGLASYARTYFLYPCAVGSCSGVSNQVGYSSGGYDNAFGPTGTNGRFVAGNCKVNNGPAYPGATAPGRYCTSSISNLNGSANFNTYYIRLTAQYTPLTVTIQGTNSGGNNPTVFDGAQGIIDVTGQGTNVLQRVRARVDLDKTYQLPDYAIQSMDTLCKGFQVEVTGPGTYGPVDNSPVSSYGSCAAPSDGGSVSSAAGDLAPHTGVGGGGGGNVLNVFMNAYSANDLITDTGGFGISCYNFGSSGTCSKTFGSVTTVTLYANEASGAGSDYKSWSGCDSVSGHYCTIKVSGNVSVTANFAKK